MVEDTGGGFPDTVIEVVANGPIQCCVNPVLKVIWVHPSGAETLLDTVNANAVNDFYYVTYEALGGDFQIQIRVEFYCNGQEASSCSLTSILYAI